MMERKQVFGEVVLLCKKKKKNHLFKMQILLAAALEIQILSI